MLNKEISISLKNIEFIEKLESAAKESNASSSSFLNYWKRKEKEKINIYEKDEKVTSYSLCY